MRRTTLLALVLLLIFCQSCRGTGSAITINKPLYVDPAGWEIRSALDGETIVYHYYERPVERLRAYELEVPDMGALEEMYMEGACKYWGLVLVIPEGVKTYWTLESRIALLYWMDGELQETMSTQLFLIQKCDLQAVDLWERESFTIPPPYDIFHTPNENPVLFVRFTLDAVPDTLVSCNVYGVLTN